jgi:GT2 family glycosyltransferase
MLQHLFSKSNSSIVGCNFSLYRDDLLAINGFDEAYHSPGIGEDSDLELRLRNNGVRMKSNKLVAIQYHLYHPRMYAVSDENRRLLTAASDTIRCRQGIDSHRETPDGSTVSRS